MLSSLLCQSNDNSYGISRHALNGPAGKSCRTICESQKSVFASSRLRRRAPERGGTGGGGRSRAAGAGPNRARRGERRRAEADPRHPSGPAGAAFGRPVCHRSGPAGAAFGRPVCHPSGPAGAALGRPVCHPSGPAGAALGRPVCHPSGPSRPGAGRPGRPVPGRPPSARPDSRAIGRRDLRLAWTGLCAPVRWRGRDCARFTGRLKSTAQRAAGYGGRPPVVVPGDRGRALAAVGPVRSGGRSRPGPGSAGGRPLAERAGDWRWPPGGAPGPASVGIMLAGSPSASADAVRADVSAPVGQRTAFLQADHLRPAGRGRAMQMFPAIFYHGVEGVIR
jgi:hypothetical protein